MPYEPLETRDLNALILLPDADWRGLSLSGVGRGDGRETRWDEIEWQNARLGGVIWDGATWSDCRFSICDLGRGAGRQSHRHARRVRGLPLERNWGRAEAIGAMSVSPTAI